MHAFFRGIKKRDGRLNRPTNMGGLKTQTVHYKHSMSMADTGCERLGLYILSMTDTDCP